MRIGALVIGLMLLVVAGPVRAEVKSSVVTNVLGDETRGEPKELLKERRLQLVENKTATREGFLRRLGEIRDTRKRALVEKLNSQICQLNERRSQTEARHLAKMSDILDRVSARLQTAKAVGKDTAAAETAVSNARSAIAEASTAVASQANRTCGIVLSGDEGKLGQEVRTERNGLETELKSVHQKVVAARKAVAEAIRALAHVLGEGVPDGVNENASKSGGRR